MGLAPAETATLVDQYIAEHAAAGFTKWRLADHDDHLVGRAGFGPQLEVASWATPFDAITGGEDGRARPLQPW